MEGNKEKAAEEFLSNLVKGTEWEDHVYIAGGYVRDQILGIDAKDIDLVVSLPEGGIKFAEWATKKMGNYKEHSNPVLFQKFGTSKFTLSGVTYKGIDLSDMDIEAVMTRSEKYTAGSRKPDVAYGDLKKDVERRDATINSLLKKLSSGEILDLTGKGIADIKAGIVRTPIDPDQTFTDDPLRILRMIRMSAKYNWKMPMDILRSIKKNAPQLTNISKERIHDEINKCLLSDFPFKAFRLLQLLGLMRYTFPSLEGADLSHMKKMNELQKDLPLRLVAALKNVPPEEIQREMSTLRYTSDNIRLVQMVVTRLPEFLKKVDTLTDADLRQYRAEISNYFGYLLSYAAVYAPTANMADIKQRYAAVSQEMAENPLPVTGQDLIQLGMKPGPEFKKYLELVKQMYIKNPKTSKETYLKAIHNEIPF